MRATATIIGILALFLSSCSVVPQFKGNDPRLDLNKLKGPDVTSMQNTLKEQAEQATQKGDYKRASQIYKQMSDKEPENKEYSVALADSLRRSGNNDGALKIVDGILKKSPENADALEVRGLAQINKGEFPEASKTFGEVMKIDAKRWRTLNGIGILFAMKNLHEEAMAYFQEALNQVPDNATVLNNVGLMLAIDKDYDRSLEAFESARSHAVQDSAEAKRLDLNEALVYAVMGRLEESERLASKHLSKAQLYNNLGFYAYLAKNNDLAKGYLNMALTQSSTYYERAWRNLGTVTGDNALLGNEDKDEKIPTLRAVKKSESHAGTSLDEIPESKPISDK